MFVVDPQDKIKVRGFDEPLDLLRLRRSISNINKSLILYSATDIADSAKINYLTRAIDCTLALNKLLRCDEVPSLFMDIFLEKGNNMEDSSSPKPTETSNAKIDIEKHVSDLRAFALECKNSIKLLKDEIRYAEKKFIATKKENKIVIEDLENKMNKTNAAVKALKPSKSSKQTKVRASSKNSTKKVSANV